MESNDVPRKTKLSSELGDKESDESFHNSMSDKGLLTSGSKPKIQLLELAENIQAAETNYDSIKMQWDYMKSLHHRDQYNKEDTQSAALSQRSIASSRETSSLKIASSDHSFQPEEIENEDYRKVQDQEDNNMLDNDQQKNEVQVVITPRSPNDDTENQEKFVPKLEIYETNSLESIKTNVRTKKGLKSKKKPRNERVNDEPIKTSLIYTAKAKRKKFHGRLKTSNSKSTIATRESHFSDKKADRRKFKRQKSLDKLSVCQGQTSRKRANPLKARESKQLTNPKDFIEIYHNSALKCASPSLVSTRQSKIESVHNELAIQAVDDSKSRKEFQSTEQIQETFDLREKSEIGDKNYDRGHMHSEEHINVASPEFYDPFYQRNYEMPTMASKMKRVRRPYYHRFNIRNIPFIVGTSITPSHNLGLNIQQVLSLIKTRQPMVPAISPLLIRKISKGIRPVSTLFEHISNEYSKSYRNLKYHGIARGQRSSTGFNQNIGPLSFEQLRVNNATTSMTNQSVYKQNITCEPLYEEDEESHSSLSETRARNQILQEKSNPYEVQLGPDGTASKSLGSRQQLSNRQKSLRSHGQQLADAGIGDTIAPNEFNYPNNNKEMSEVFTRLYAQFHKMITQQEKLKEQYEKRKDKALAKEIAEMESAIRAKEQEITAVVNLYKEVMSLKQQMKLLHERNSFVCIATEDPMFHHASKLAKSQARAHTAGPFQSNTKYSYNRRYYGLHETPNALRLAGLLRQIQAFQRQLALP